MIEIALAIAIAIAPLVIILTNFSDGPILARRTVFPLIFFPGISKRFSISIKSQIWQALVLEFFIFLICLYLSARHRSLLYVFVSILLSLLFAGRSICSGANDPISHLSSCQLSSYVFSNTISEECLLRWLPFFLIKSLGATRYEGLVIYVLFSSILFTIWHLYNQDFIVATKKFLLGVLWGSLVWYSGVTSSLVVHFVYNSVVPLKTHRFSCGKLWKSGERIVG